jgi:hypothetical protein
MSEMTVNLPRTVAVAALMLIAFPVQANDTGLSVLHALRREGGRTCFFDHYHYGDSSGKKTERAAKAGAVESWAGFVALEYGSDWANFSRAHSKSTKCEHSPAGWECLIEARPCL